MAPYSLDGVVKREGYVSVKRAGLLRTWKSFSQRWVVLRSTSLCIFKNSMELDCVARINLNGITRLERTDIPRKGHCLRLDVAGAQWLFAFVSDNDLYSWHDSIYSVSPLTIFKSTNADETEVDLENIISGYSTSTPSSEFSMATPSPSKPLFRPSTHSPASSRVLLVDEEPLKSTVSLHARSFSHSTALSSGSTTIHSRSISHSTSSSSPIPPLPLRSTERQLLRDAVGLLCDLMEPRLLRKSDPGGEKPVDLVEMRLRPLARLRRKWRQPAYDVKAPITTDPAVEDEQEMRVFAEALRDGYVLCQLLNTLNGNTVVRPDDRNTNINKFLAATAKLAASGDIQQAPLFLPLDLEEATGYSLGRVATTIIALIEANSAATLRAKSPTPSAASIPRAPTPQRVATPPLTLAERARAELAQWQPRFEAQTRERVAECAGADEYDIVEKLDSEFPDSKVYQHLISFVSQSKPAQDNRFQAALLSLVQFMASLDLLWSLVQSFQLRVEILKLSSIFNVSNDRQLRLAIEKDEADLGRLLQRVVGAERHKKRLLCLRGESAQCAVDFIQNVLDKGSLPASSTSVDSENFTLKARRLLVRLSEASDTLPASLFIRGVMRVDQEATFGGTFGDIYRASYEQRDVALKRMRVFQRNSEWHKLRQRFCREALLWQRLQHPFVLPFTGIDAESFPSFLCMVSPWMKHGTILKHLAENGNANVERRLFEIAQGLAYLHSQDIIHGDLRGSNILVDDGWHARLADFGLAVFSDATIATQTSHRGGSVRWMSPELHLPQSCGLDTFRRTFASDVYSFAFVCIELSQGKAPFFDIAHDAAVMLRVMSKERPPRPYDTVSGRPLISDSLWAIVQQCWAHDVVERPTMARVVEMMQEGNDELRIETSLNSSPPGKQPYQVHRASTTRRRPPAAAAATTSIYQSLSF
uniref:Non-specific serine/threonine protein kinase n=1 Tax=Mycena chlorophos TaxID=658473 RepID=A0ABQ0L3J8_MYCCL|nr:predicted protein [Mycena chlorophos]